MPVEKVIAFPSQKAAPTPRHKKRADGRYRTKAYYQDPATGARKEKCFYGDTYSEADKKKREFLRQLESGISPDAFSITVSEYVDKWLALRKLKDKDRKTTATYDMHVRECARLKDALGKKQLRHVTQSDLAAIIHSRQGLSQSAIKKTFTVLHQVFLSAMGDRLITFDPMLGLDRPSGSSGTHRALEEWEKQMIFTHWQGHRAGFMAILMLFTGMRRGEVCALDWQDIDFSASVIHVRRALSFVSAKNTIGAPKTAAGIRDVPILPPLLSILQQRALPSGPVCPGLDGGPMLGNASDCAWKSFLNYLGEIRTGCPRGTVAQKNRKAIREQPDLYSAEKPKYTWQPVSIRTHDLRHTYCTMLYDAGVDVKTAQLLMGHASVDVTMQIYTHLSQQRKLSSLDRLTAFSSSWGAGLSADGTSSSSPDHPVNPTPPESNQPSHISPSAPASPSV